MAQVIYMTYPDLRFPHKTALPCYLEHVFPLPPENHRTILKTGLQESLERLERLMTSCPCGHTALWHYEHGLFPESAVDAGSD